MKKTNRVLAITVLVLNIVFLFFVILKQNGVSLQPVMFISVIFGIPSIIATFVSFFFSSFMWFADNCNSNKISLRYSLIAVAITAGTTIFLVLELAKHM